MIQQSNQKKAERFLDRLRRRGFRAYFVGGAVRDMLMGKSPVDVDIVTDADARQIMEIFRDYPVRQVGVTFNVCLVDSVEIASGRSGSKAEPFPESDLAKRDLTVNSMAYDPETQQFIDPFSGKKDLEQKVVRFTRDPEQRILEDPLRMIRACRFAAFLEGTIAPTSMDAIRKFNHRVHEMVAKERIRIEILKAMPYPKPSLFFQTLSEAGILPMIFPSLARCGDLDGGPHHDETVFHHCLLVGDALSSRRPLLRLAGYLHDAGKYDAATLKDGKLRFAGHEKMRKPVLKDLENLTFSSRELAYIDSMLQVHMRPLNDGTTPKAVRRLLAFLEAHSVTWQDFMRLRIADKRGNLAKHPYRISDIRLRIQKLSAELNRESHPAFSIKDLAVSGHDVMTCLNLKPGPDVGRVLAFLFEQVLDEPSMNTRDKLIQLMLLRKH